ncbi:Uncharacterised protein [Shigella sonnei]|nr:Uncharacterised protein [Shigella sonnei]
MRCEGKRHAEQQVAEGDTEDYRRHQTADDQTGVPHFTPACIGDFSAIIKGQRAEEQ